MIGPRDYVFEGYIRGAAGKNMVGAIAGIIALGALGLFFFGFGVVIPLAPLIIFGLLVLGGMALIIIKFKGDLKGGDFWINMLLQEPQRIVWIKPVNVRHTAAYVLTLYNEMHFMLHTSDGLKIMIKCDSQQDQLTFLRGMKQYVPHAHLGYSADVLSWYNYNSVEFIRNLQSKNIYQPVQGFQVG